MTTPVVDQELDELIYGDDDLDEDCHYVHLECQEGKVFVVAMCGFTMDRGDLLPEDKPVKPCEVCVKVRGCPLCGF